MKWTSPPSSYRYCTFFVSVCTRGNFSPARNVRSTTAPESRPFSFVRTNAPPLPGFTCWKSTMRHGWPSSSMCMPFLNWFVLTVSATAQDGSDLRLPCGQDLPCSFSVFHRNDHLQRHVPNDRRSHTGRRNERRRRLDAVALDSVRTELITGLRTFDRAPNGQDGLDIHELSDLDEILPEPGQVLDPVRLDAHFVL